MRAITFARFGEAASVAALSELPEPLPLGAGEILVSVEVSPIEQADLQRAAGHFPGAELPFVGGLEGMGRVIGVSEGAGPMVGTRVLLPVMSGAWRERIVVPAHAVVALPDAPADPRVLGQLTVNPPTAWLMLRSAPLAPGDFVVQNAAASSCGRYVVGLARFLGLRTINVVRGLHNAAALRALGADHVLEDGPDLGARVRAATGGVGARLAIDAVGGSATARLVDGLSDGGELIVYGKLEGAPCVIDPDALCYRRVTARGFFLRPWLEEASAAEIADTYRTLADLAIRGEIASEVEAVYPLAQAAAALAHAARSGRTGRILISPDGSLV